MPQPIEATTTQALGLALDAASLRQRAIAANIANHATEGYVPMKLDFASQMDEARRALDAKGALEPGSLAGVQPRLVPALDSQGRPEKVKLDAEMAAMAENAVQYQALARALGRHLSLLAIAAQDGKR